MLTRRQLIQSGALLPAAGYLLNAESTHAAQTETAAVTPSTSVTSLAPVADFNNHIVPADSPFQAVIVQLVGEIAQRRDIPGATVAIVVDGRLVASAGIGVRKSGLSELIRADDPMHIGSNTKGMTALLFGRMVEQGKLRFDETLQEAFSYTVSSDFAHVPLIELLYQRSGMTDKTVPDIFAPKYNPADRADWYHAPASLYSKERQLYTKDCLMGMVSYSPGSKHQYCNSNFVVAGAAIEAASGGTSWEDLMQREVFTPLSMKSAGFGPMGTGKDTGVPWQHEKVGNAWRPIYHDNPGYFGPAGRVYCSALDLANYAYARVAGSYRIGGYLTAATWKTLQTPPTGGSYACGIAVSGIGSRGIRDMSHGGSNNLSCSDWWVRDQGRAIVVVMMNCFDDDGIHEALNKATRATETHFSL